MDKSSRNRGNQNNSSNNRSQRRLALAVLLVLMLGFFWFMSTDNPSVKEFRDRHFMEQSDNAEDQASPDTEESGNSTGSSEGGTAESKEARKMFRNSTPLHFLNSMESTM